MPYGLWMAAVLPVIAAGGTLHFKMKEQTDKRWNILPKCLATWMMVCTSAVGIYQNGSRHAAACILISMILFLLADALLEIRFFWGMIVFAAGHFLLIGWFIVQGNFHPASLPIWLFLLAGTLVLFRKELKGGKENPLLYLMILYPAVLLAMTAMALTLPFTADERYTWAAVGAVLFAVSDMMVGKGFFKKLPPKLDFFALAMYYCGIFCLSMMTWNLP